MITVYIITEKGVVKYVGKTKDYTRRKREHLKRIGTSLSAIPTDIDLSTIEFNPIALYTDEVQALKFEDGLIRKHNTIENGWNTYRSGNVFVEDRKSYMKAYYNTPEYKDKKKSYMKAYEQNPERKARKKACDKAYHQTPEWKAYIKAYKQTPEYKEYMHQYRLRKKQERAAV